MIISFDLDGTLIPYTNEGNHKGLVGKLFGIEQLRAGTKQLFTQLQRDNHKIFIYTTSYRKAYYIRILFALYFLRVDKIINQQRHNKALKQHKNLATKLPHRFGIDLHIDDSEGVRQEGDKLGFRVLVIGEDDKNWAGKILDEVAKINSF